MSVDNEVVDKSLTVGRETGCGGGVRKQREEERRESAEGGRGNISKSRRRAVRQ